MAIREGCHYEFWGLPTNFPLWFQADFPPHLPFGFIFTLPEEVTVIPFADNLTLLGAIQGSFYVQDGPSNTRELIIQAVAALLNAGHPDVNYPIPTSEVRSRFNNTLATLDGTKIAAQVEEFKVWNEELICPLRL